MLANISPAQSEADETLSTLRFADSVKKVKTKAQVNELAPEEPEIILMSFRSEVQVLQSVLQQESGSGPQSPKVARELEGAQHLMQSFSARTGARWAEAVEQSKALGEMHKQVLSEMCLAADEVGQLVGLDSGTPYLLNISDDPALSGSLLYFLRPEPDVTTVGRAVDNRVVLRGLGIPDHLCELRFQPEPPMVVIRNCCTDTDRGRLMINGKPLTAEDSQELNHADRIVFGWAFCFRLVFSGAPDIDRSDGQESFESVAREVMINSMTAGQAQGMKAAAYWHGELTRRNVQEDEADQMITLAGEVTANLEEANALCAEIHEASPTTLRIEMDVGMCVSFMKTTEPPHMVIQVWRRDGDRGRQFVAAWSLSTFERRLPSLRDAHRHVVQGLLRDAWVQRLGREEWWCGDGQDDPNSEPTSDAESDPDRPPRSAPTSSRLL
mmetsp:Transcript_72757/g.194169  ORF Transcript_72757/g.194169 Transcript_72757/m.194169 type:complete len:440 (-) Transcript_72757:139-1458(-)